MRPALLVDHHRADRPGQRLPVAVAEIGLDLDAAAARGAAPRRAPRHQQGEDARHHQHVAGQHAAPGAALRRIRAAVILRIGGPIIVWLVPERSRLAQRVGLLSVQRLGAADAPDAAREVGHAHGLAAGGVVEPHARRGFTARRRQHHARPAAGRAGASADDPHLEPVARAHHRPRRADRRDGVAIDAETDVERLRVRGETGDRGQGAHAHRRRHLPGAPGAALARPGGADLARHVPEHLAPSALVGAQPRRQAVPLQGQLGGDRLVAEGGAQEQALRLARQQHAKFGHQVQRRLQNLQRQPGGSGQRVAGDQGPRDDREAAAPSGNRRRRIDGDGHHAGGVGQRHRRRALPGRIVLGGAGAARPDPVAHRQARDRGVRAVARLDPNGGAGAGGRRRLGPAHRHFGRARRLLAHAEHAGRRRVVVGAKGGARVQRPGPAGIVGGRHRHLRRRHPGPVGGQATGKARDVSLDQLDVDRHAGDGLPRGQVPHEQPGRHRGPGDDGGVADPQLELAPLEQDDLQLSCPLVLARTRRQQQLDLAQAARDVDVQVRAPGDVGGRGDDRGRGRRARPQRLRIPGRLDVGAAQRRQRRDGGESEHAHLHRQAAARRDLVRGVHEEIQPARGRVAARGAARPRGRNEDDHEDQRERRQGQRSGTQRASRKETPAPPIGSQR